MSPKYNPFGISNAIMGDGRDGPIRSPSRIEQDVSRALGFCKPSEPLSEADQRAFDELWEKHKSEKVREKSFLAKGWANMKKNLPFLRRKHDPSEEPNNGTPGASTSSTPAILPHPDEQQ